jgi:hypothetical protein
MNPATVFVKKLNVFDYAGSADESGEAKSENILA